MCMYITNNTKDSTDRWINVLFPLNNTEHVSVIMIGRIAVLFT